ncbi:glycine--tRNA ligase subunit beta [Halothermothrix orenii]|uniref:Glycine--tRNA ligase beta subunit n=1 Tax=Halothermothrix orenii (strain H 168 / OCM 544 / DSM 9562) TaxID=373903 RepID=SYGB_HALOH|nr:glycine--tRNA ligase subunit beta [Halothermothrix orenii]B8CXH5.1 RecName: Full=Glycine--tRNA ligase beta subunit; AltName: Full=Glycyl-tRNA synthetase beta subunit; Short=GlyRS [Halothermothrix orenii H 168]ACL69994.1 glycyl-tRNA synthetase, beta subunit [Halothermothrix orenii H 168]
MARDLLFEIGTEEMPAGLIGKIRSDLKDLAINTLEDKRLDFKECKVFSTPRRLVLFVKELAEKQEEKREVVKGPARSIAFEDDGTPTRAAKGFSRAQGVEVDDLIIKDDYVYVEKIEQGQDTAGLLKDILPGLINKLPLPRSMRWADYNFKFIRPIRWLLALFGEEIISFSMAGVQSGAYTRGHRFLVKDRLEVKDPDHYFDVMEKGYIIVDHNKRRELILKQIREIEKEIGKVMVEDDLLTEVVDLVEYPTAFYGKFDRSYLELPDDVLITSMAEHQRYFPVIDEDGSLSPYFVGVRDGIEDYIEEVRYGNEMVLRARLADARFFFEEDLKVSIEERQKELEEIVFQEDLGSMMDKVKRLKQLVIQIGKSLNLKESQLQSLIRAAELSKNDLVTEMVNEFTKLQGVMGREYALINGEDEEVATAIYEQYLPRYSGDRLPQTLYGRILSIADKIDNITSHFSLGMIPSGSQDPFALRRQANGIVNIIIDAQLPLKLSSLLNWSIEVLEPGDKDFVNEEKSFLLQRLETILDERGIRYDIINSVVRVGDDDPNNILSRAEAVMSLRKENPDLFVDLIQGLVRARNLASKGEGNNDINPEYFECREEKELYDIYRKIKDEIQRQFKKKNYLSGLKKLVDVKEPVDNFLDNVVVMVEDERIKNNRLALLQEISNLVSGVMNISEIALDD